MDHSPNISQEFDQISFAQFWHWGGIINTKDITESINRQQIWQINWEPSYQQFAEAQRASRHIPRKIENNSSFNDVILDLNCLLYEASIFKKMLINYLVPNNSLEEHNQYPVELHEEIKEEKRFDEV